jgi:hypothetical protein
MSSVNTLLAKRPILGFVRICRYEQNIFQPTVKTSVPFTLQNADKDDVGL